MFLRWLDVMIHNYDHSIGEDNAEESISKVILEYLVSSRAITGDLVSIKNQQTTQKNKNFTLSQTTSPQHSLNT